MDIQRTGIKNSQAEGELVPPQRQTPERSRRASSPFPSQTALLEKALALKGNPSADEPTNVVETREHPSFVRLNQSDLIGYVDTKVNACYRVQVCS